MPPSLSPRSERRPHRKLRRTADSGQKTPTGACPRTSTAYTGSIPSLSSEGHTALTGSGITPPALGHHTRPPANVHRPHERRLSTAFSCRRSRDLDGMRQNLPNSDPALLPSLRRSADIRTTCCPSLLQPNGAKVPDRSWDSTPGTGTGQQDTSVLQTLAGIRTGTFRAPLSPAGTNRSYRCYDETARSGMAGTGAPCDVRPPAQHRLVRRFLADGTKALHRHRRQNRHLWNRPDPAGPAHLQRTYIGYKPSPLAGRHKVLTGITTRRQTLECQAGAIRIFSGIRFGETASRSPDGTQGAHGKLGTTHPALECQHGPIPQTFNRRHGRDTLRRLRRTAPSF